MPTTNTTAEAVNKVIADANSVGVQFVETLIIADQPWLGAPIFKQILGWVLAYFDGYISKAEQTGATFIVIDAQVAGEESAMSQALAAVLAAQKSGDKDALKIAIQAYADANSRLGSYDGAAKL